MTACAGASSTKEEIHELLEAARSPSVALHSMSVSWRPMLGIRRRRNSSQLTSCQPGRGQRLKPSCRSARRRQTSSICPTKAGLTSVSSRSRAWTNQSDARMPTPARHSELGDGDGVRLSETQVGSRPATKGRLRPAPAALAAAVAETAAAGRTEPRSRCASLLVVDLAVPRLVRADASPQTPAQALRRAVDGGDQAHDAVTHARHLRVAQVERGGAFVDARAGSWRRRRRGPSRRRRARRCSGC